VEAWTGGRGKTEAARLLSEVGVAAAPCHRAEDVVNDPHVAARRMLVEVPRPDGVDQPVLIGGNPLKMSKVAEGPEGWYPALGEHTEEVLKELLGTPPEELERYRQAGVTR
jgi:crotonobetainyl-CoA:carnitine CoA-transferase CaiB-like acyl-CoA transferase